MSTKVEKPLEKDVTLYAIKTAGGQEPTVAEIISSKASLRGIPIRSVLILRKMQGFVLVESPAAHYIDAIVAGMKHVKSRMSGVIKMSEIEHLIVTKPMIEELGINDIVEVVAGPLKGSRSKIARVDKTKSEIILELLETTFSLSMSVPVDYVKIVEKAPSTAKKEESLGVG